MGFLKGIFDFADDLVSIPTDLIGLTNHYEKKEALEKLKRLLWKVKLRQKSIIKLKNI